MINRLKRYYINNTTSTDQVITLTEQTTCDGFVVVEDFSQIAYANMETEIKFPNDGTFTVYVDAQEDGIAYSYLGLFESMILFISASLCANIGTNCITSPNCLGEVPNHLNNAISKILLYSSVNNPKYDDAVVTALQKIHCTAKVIEDRIRSQEQYLGLSNTDELLKVELGHLYLELYKVDAAGELPADQEGLKEIYDYNNISYCIARLGILDCEPPAPLPGAEHTRFFSVDPTSFGSGIPTDVTVSYRFTKNDDEFLAVIDTNVPNVDISKFDGFTYNEVISGETAGKSYYITYTYLRGGITLQNTVTAKTTTYPPQWYGGETVEDDFEVAGKASFTDITAKITNVQPVYKNTSNGSSSNTNTQGKYIYWITKNPVKFFIGAFQIPTGPWDANCDPTSYSIISKQITTVMADVVTEEPLYFYRTCPLQNLQGQTLEYTLVQ